jgi:RNA polymerase sigma factor (sigma-70 family)
MRKPVSRYRRPSLIYVPLLTEPIELRVVSDAPPAELLAAAGAGDAQAWSSLVDRYHRLVWSVVRSFRLDASAAADVVQTVWLRLVENWDRIRDPDKLASWLATTARNESLRSLKHLSRQTPTEFELDVRDPTVGDLDERLVEREVERSALAAFNELGADCRRLLRLLCADPPLDYDAIAEIIGRPVGSIGPTRGRCLDQLRRIMERHPGITKGDGR